MPAKRKSLPSIGGGGATKAARTDLHVPVDALLKESVRTFDSWLRLSR